MSLLQQAHNFLGWPKRDDIFHPRGAGPQVISYLANTKIGREIRRFNNSEDVNIGILTSSPNNDTTSAPLGIICEFSKPISEEVLLKAQKLAWNFSWAPQLISIEPHLIRSFTCCKPPRDAAQLNEYEIVRVRDTDLGNREAVISHEVALSLHWVQLISGHFFEKNKDKFRRDQRADQRLLSNLRFVRSRLLKDGLNVDICHDLLARVIFIQFLMDRKDNSGNAALTTKQLKEISGIPYNNLHEILRCKKDAYDLFEFLDTRFNGDLFSHKDDSQEKESYSLEDEYRNVESSHLNTLADLIEGTLDMEGGQLCLWPQYLFDVIPLEFISSIYEEFVTEKYKEEEQTDNEKIAGKYYTPAHLVDFILDSVLPWNGQEWDLKILDPACGSGIFLVKAFQRLVHRWQQSHNNNRPSVNVLRRILQHNIFGVDINPHAIRVASFSLYLAMCDYIEPRYLWTRVKFPDLRNETLYSNDFFDECGNAFTVSDESEFFDIIIGNAPWGRNKATEKAISWAKEISEEPWPIPDNNPGPLFLAKAALLAKKSGHIAMIQPAQTLLASRSGPAKILRRRLFSEFSFEMIVNLSALRFVLFKRSSSPACIAFLKPEKPHNKSFFYICPKPTSSDEDNYRIIIEPQDINYVRLHEAINHPNVWSTLMWGSRRDFIVLEKLAKAESLKEIQKTGSIKQIEGIIWGQKEQKKDDWLAQRRIFDLKNFGSTSEEFPFLIYDVNKLPINSRIVANRPRSNEREAFNVPQLIIKQSWQSGGRFYAVLLYNSKSKDGAICSQSYLSIHSDLNFIGKLEAFCLVFNSILSLYVLFLTSARCAFYRHEPLQEEIMSIPIPPIKPNVFKSIRNYTDIDEFIRKAFEIGDVEWALIEDFAQFTIPMYKGQGKNYPSSLISAELRDPDSFTQYCHFFRTAMKAALGEKETVTAYIYCENKKATSPVRLISFIVNSADGDVTKSVNLESSELYEKLEILYRNFLSQENYQGGGIRYQRTARVYTFMDNSALMINIIKPNYSRYWFRSLALSDAEAVFSDMQTWKEAQLDKGIYDHE